MASSVRVSGSDEDRTRFFRLSLVIIEELTQILRDLLSKEVSPAQINNKVKHLNYLNLRPEQIVVLSHAQTRGYQEFDITLLYTLIRNVCQNISPPSQNWGVCNMPSPLNELTVGDDIERIRLIRNKVYGHICEVAIPETEFKEYFSIISGICTRMQTLLNNDYVKRIQEAKECTIDADTEKKYIDVIKRLADEEKSTRDLISKFAALTSKETLKIQACVAEKETIVETITDTSISILNEMVASVNELTSESDVKQIYESIDDFIRENGKEPENLHLQNLLKKLKDKIKGYAEIQKTNQIKILANFHKFCLRMQREYGAHVESSRSSILLLVTFSSISDYILYKNDLENGKIGEQLMELFLFPPFLGSFSLKEDDIEITLNGRLLTQRKELTSKETLKIQARDAEKETIVETLIDTSISILNEMVAAIHELTSESDVNQIYESIDDFVRENKKEPENLHLQNLLKKLKDKIKVYAEIQKTNQIKILANFHKFCLRMQREYGAHVECSRSSILLLVTCSSTSGYILYKKDLENGKIGEQLMELFLFPPFLGSFGLKEDDIEITLNGRLLTQRKERTSFKSHITWPPFHGYKLTALKKMSHEEEDPMVMAVIAIDIGTTYSGYAFSLQSDFQRDPTKISCTTWIPATGVIISPKTPTSLLLKPNKEFYKFGYDAEDKYAELAMDGEHHDYYFFRRFKMPLHINPNLSSDTKIEDASGKELPAMDVFGHGISYLKKHAVEQINLREIDLEERDVRWVLTVPAIWTEGAIQCMRMAAQKAGILNEQLLIALEPEAASLFCRYIPDATDVFKSDSKYMVIDLGGGTADITVHKVDYDGTLQELHRATDGACGGTKVDAAYEQFFIDIVGEFVWEEFSFKYREDYLAIFRDFEFKKRIVRDNMKTNIVVKVPFTLRMLFEEMTSIKFDIAVRNNEIYFQKIRPISDRIKIDPELVIGFFKDPLDKLIEHLQELLLKENLKGTKTFLLVGGFSESPIVQETLHEKFPHIRLITPNDAGLTVLKGAVIFGHEPLSIRSRISRFTIGIAVSKPFIESDHPPAKRLKTASGIMCKDNFYKYIECDESVEDGSFHWVSFSMGRESTVSRVRVYSTSVKDPVFVTDKGCIQLGELIINVGNIERESDRVSVGLSFGATEITVEARDMTSGKIFRAKFDFLSN